MRGEGGDFYANLAEEMPDRELSRIGNDLSGEVLTLIGLVVRSGRMRIRMVWSYWDLITRSALSRFVVPVV